ncbi:hypothetical protein G9A89_004445 [Geosiphon pyriformis]|nr:hypothetical protein G9A89_004445 [Geosiphon pyriformis]
MSTVTIYLGLEWTFQVGFSFSSSNSISEAGVVPFGLNNNNFKVTTTPDTTTLEYYQSIYTHCKQKFNIPDGIEIVKKTLYQYIENCINNYLLGDYNISEVRSNLYNNLVHYLQLKTKDLNSETLVTYFQKLNFNIIKYCEETYLVQSKYFLDFKLETETSNKDKQKVNQYSKTTPNTPILPKTIAKYLQTLEQRTSVKLLLSIIPFLISLAQSQTPNSSLNCFFRPKDFHTNIIDYLQENESNNSENLESEKTESKQEETTENKKEIAAAYIAKIPEFTGKDNDTSSQEWLNKIQKAGNTNSWNAAKMLKFENLKKLFGNWQAFKNAFLQQFTDNNISITLHNHFHNIKQKTSETIITYLEKFNKLLRRIQQLETNDYYSDFIAGLKNKLIKKVCPHAPEDLTTAIRHVKNYEMAIEEANHTKLTTKSKQLLLTSFTTNAATILAIFTNSAILNIIHSIISSTSQKIVLRNSVQQKSTQFYTQPSKVAAPRSNSSNNTIPPAQIVQNANLSDIFPFEFETNKSLFLLSNAAVNEQKAITAMYIKATIKRKPIQLILDSRSTGSIITYQLIQQLNQNVNRPIQTVIVTADGMKKTLVREINNFLFTIDGIIIPVKVLLFKANANLNWETQELKISYQRQYIIVLATSLVFEFEEKKKMPLTEIYMALGSTSNWAEETEQKIFEKTRR